MEKIIDSRQWYKYLLFITATFLFAFYEDASAAQTKELPIFNPSFEDWNDSYPLFSNYTTTVPTGWDLKNTGYAPCDAVVKTHSRCSARTGEYAAFFDSRSYSNALKSNTYKLSEGTYTFSVYAATIGYGGTKLTLKVDGAVNKSLQFSVTGSSYSYSKYSLSFNMESEGEVRFWIDNSKEWDGNSTISHFAIDDWSLTTSDGAILDFNSSNVYNDGNYTYYLYNNGTAELAFVTNKDISGEVTIPETIYVNNTQYIVRSISPYAFSGCNSITSIVFPKRLYTIGKKSFENCRSLNSVVFPTYLQSIGEEAFVGCENLNEAVFMSKTKPSVDSNVFGPQVQLYVPKIADYSSFGDRVNGLAYINEDILYTGLIPNLNLLTPASVSISSLNKESLQAVCGKYTLPASFASHGMSVEGEIVVSIQPTSLNIIAPDLRRQFGENNPQIELMYEGFVNGETPEVLLNKPTISLECNSHSDVGNYPIVLTDGTAANYTINYTHGNLKIDKRDLRVRVKNAIISYGQDLPEFQLEYEGLANFDNSPKWDVAPQFITVAAKGSNVGEYSVSVNCEPHNYNVVESINGCLLISKAPLILRANDISREYYEENPEFEFSLEGLCNNDDYSVLSKLPKFECPASLTVSPGTYQIIPSDAESKNYDINYQNGILTVTPANLLLIANDVQKEYGEINPKLTFRGQGLKGSDDIASVLTSPPILTSEVAIETGVGQYPIAISGGSSNNYKLIYSEGTFTITKAPLSIVAENAERMYGDNNPTFVRTYLGFKLSDSENNAFSVLPKISCSATKSSNVGEYPIIVSGGTSKNYEIMSYENGILTITKATAILTPINKERYYFEENPSFDFTLSGLRNNDSKSCVTVLPQYTCSATKLSDVGTYTINASGATAANYSFEYGEGSLIVNPRQLTAGVGNYSRIYGTDNPIFEISYTGFVNNENASILSQPSVATCSATKLSDVGSYPITISGGSATNYIITNYNNGTLTIDKADQTITWNQDLSSIELYSQVELDATSTSGLLVSYEMSPNNVATLYSNSGKWYLDCYGSGAVNIRATQNGDKNYNAANTITKTLVVYGGGDDPQNPQIYLNIEEPGTLSTMIADNRKYQIKNLRLTGFLNGTDICFLREMSGSDNIGNSTPGVLETLDISGCTIVEGGRSYYKSSRTTDYVVGDYMFYNCKSLTTLHLPNNSVRIGNNSLADCDRLSVISIPNSVNKIGTEAFKNDISLMRIPMPDALTTIEDLAFMGCNGLTELIIPSEVSVIGDGIVKDCQNIERISVESDNSNFTSVDGVLFNKNQDRLIIFPVNHSSNEYTVPEGVKTIAPYAFVNSKNLKSVSLPSSMSIIGQDAFIGCVNLQTLKVKAITPPVCQNDCFESVSKTRCELQVPMGCRSSYWVAPVWSEFNKIVETDFSGIDPVYYNDVHIEITNGKISISGCPNDLVISIYQINGTLLYQSEASDNVVEFKPSSHGVLLVVIGNKTYKVSL